MQKQCSTCLTIKLLDDFPLRASAKDGHRGQCQMCINERGRAPKRVAYARLWRQNNKERLSVQRKKRNRFYKLAAMSHYGGAVCACCGETHVEFLGFDHIDGGGTQHRKSIGNMGRQFYYWLKLQDYPGGYRILCYNCNMSLGFYGYCPHGGLE